MALARQCRRLTPRFLVLPYFDAFAHDGLGDPLPALISALEDRLSQLEPDTPSAEREKATQAMNESDITLAKPLARTGLIVVGAASVVTFADELAKAKAETTTDNSADFWEAEGGRRVAMEEFRQVVETLATPADNKSTGPTVVIVIDELDRCGPDYAPETIEVIKQFFSVPHVHFVLGVNPDALEGIVRARYGPNIDAARYLGKFIQVTLELPGLRFESRRHGERGAAAAPALGLPCR